MNFVVGLITRGCDGIEVLVRDPFCTAVVATAVRDSCFRGVAAPSVGLAVELITRGCEDMVEERVMGPCCTASTATV